MTFSLKQEKSVKLKSWKLQCGLCQYWNAEKIKYAIDAKTIKDWSQLKQEKNKLGLSWDKLFQVEASYA